MGKHIAFLIMNFSNGGGTERVTSVIANSLINRNYNVSVISCKEGEKCRFPIREKINVYSLYGEKEKNPIIRKLLTYNRLEKFVRSLQIDIVVAVDVALYLYLWPLQKKKLCKCIAWEHFNYFISPNLSVKIARTLAAKCADAVVVLGKNDADNYKSHYKRITNLRYIYNPVTIENEGTANMSSKRIVAMGRLENQKGFDYLVDIWEIIEKRCPGWKLDIFGEGKLRSNLQEKIDCLGLKNIELRGYTADVEKEFLDSSIFVLSSRYEGFGLVLLEAQSCGLPCVSFNCKEGPGEIIDDGVNGFLIDPFNVSAFAEKTIYLMENETIRLKFAEKSRKDLYRFSIESVMEQWENLFKNL